jgi:tetratricopeptide (TPR) repeat protein
VVSDVTAAVLAGRSGVEFVELGVQRLRGLADPVRAYGIVAEGVVGWGSASMTTARSIVDAPRGATGLPSPRFEAGEERDRHISATASNIPGERQALPFVGRHGEMLRLRDWWESASDTRMVLVSGEAGVGKTRLAASFARELEQDGSPVFYGRAVASEGSSYEPVLGALRQLVLCADDEGIDALGETAVGALSRLVPELAERRPVVAARASAWGDVDRSWLLGAIAGCLAGPDGPPVLLVLDDLQWADRPALLLLARLLGPDMRARVLGTCRESPGASATPLNDFLAGLRRDDRPVQRISLGGLGAGDVADFVTALGSAELSETGRIFAANLQRRTAGNPFFVRETLRQLEESGAISVAGDTWISNERFEELGISEGVKVVVAQRLSILSEPTHHALRAAAVIGGEFDLDVLTTVLGRDVNDVIATMEEAIAAGLIQENPDRIDRFGFIHALVHEVLLAELSHSRRARLEWATAEATVALHEDELDERAAELAGHFVAGAAVGDPAKAVDWCLRAAAAGMNRFAYEEAIRYYEMALRVLTARGRAAGHQRADVLIALGRAANRAGDPERWRASCLEAASIARQVGDAERLARAAISYLGSLAQGPTDPAVVRLMDEAIEAVRTSVPTPAGQALLAELLARLSGYLTNMESERSARLADEAVVAARQVGDGRSLALALMYSTQSYALGREEHQARLREAARLAEEAGDLDIVLNANSNLMAAALIWTDRDEFDRRLAEYGRVASATGAPTFLVLSAIDHAGAAALDGHYEDSARQFRDARRRSERLGDPNLRRNIGAGLSPVNRELGRFPINAYRRDLADAATPWHEAGLIRMLCDTGERDEATERLDRLLARPQPLLTGFLRRYSLAVLSEAAEALGHTEAATLLLPWLRDELAVGEGVIVGPNCYLGAIRRYAGLLALTVGDPDAAVDDHEAALGVHERLRATGWAQRSRYDLARALHARDREGDRERAAQLIAEASASAGALGMPKLLEEIFAFEQGVDRAGHRGP